MNDFTKEELNLINNALCTYLTGVSPIEMEHLQEKIQSMIDNYCAHDYKETIWQCQVTACSKCGFPSTVVKR